VVYKAFSQCFPVAAARQKLDDESANQREQLAEAGVKLDGAIANLNALLAEKTILEPEGCL